MAFEVYKRIGMRRAEANSLPDVLLVRAEGRQLDSRLSGLSYYLHSVAEDGYLALFQADRAPKAVAGLRVLFEYLCYGRRRALRIIGSKALQGICKEVTKTFQGDA